MKNNNFFEGIIKKFFTLKSFLNRKLQILGSRSPTISTQKRRKRNFNLHLGSLDFHMLLRSPPTKWIWYLEEESGSTKAINKVCARILNHVKFVKRLHVTCFFNELNSLGGCFKRLVTVKDLWLRIGYFSSSEMTNRGIYRLSQALKRLSSLEILIYHSSNAFG